LLAIPLMLLSSFSHVNRQYIKLRRRRKWWRKLGGYPKVWSCVFREGAAACAWGWCVARSQGEQRPRVAAAEVRRMQPLAHARVLVCVLRPTTPGAW
jgi:hypothetical protein